MKIVKESIENIQSVVDNKDGIDATVALTPVVAAAVIDSKKNAERIKQLLKDANAEVKDRPFEGTKEEGKTIMPKTQDLKDMKLIESTITESNDEYWQIHDRTSELLDMLFAYLREIQGEKEFINFARTQLNMTDRELHYYCDIDLNELDELDETYTNGLGNKTLKEGIYSYHIEIPGRREGYSIDQIARTATAGELVEYFSNCEPDTKVYLNNDNGYTYGSILIRNFEEVKDTDEEEGEEIDESLIENKEKKIDLYINGEYCCSSKRYTTARDFIDKIKTDGFVEYEGMKKDNKIGKIRVELKDTDKVTAKIAKNESLITEGKHPAEDKCDGKDIYFDNNGLARYCDTRKLVPNYKNQARKDIEKEFATIYKENPKPPFRAIEDESLKSKPIKEAFRTYDSLWEEVMYRLDSAAVQVNRPAAGVYSATEDLGVDFSRLHDDTGFYGITVGAQDVQGLDFAKKICDEYGFKEIPWVQKNTYQTKENGFYTIETFTSRYAPEKFKMHIFINIEAKAPHHGFVSKAKNKDKVPVRV